MIRVTASRRTFVFALGTSPLWLPVGCAHKEETPLAHLYGKDWVHGAYELYAGKYHEVQTSSEETSKDAYAMLAQKGIVALDALQQREVPFNIRVDDSEQGFTVARDVPERLKFTADMSDADREAAQAKWEKAREHIHTDYEEIRRLNWALTTLLSQTQRVRSAIENGKMEQWKLVYQLSALGEGDKPPFDLPYQVGVGDYRDVLYLLLERLEDDSKRLARVESDIVTVGLTARATDAGSGSLAANLNKVLLAVIQDSEATRPRAAVFPQTSDDRDKYLSRGKELFASIKADPAYLQWEKHEKTKAFDQIGAVLGVVDQFTGLHTSVIYKQVLDIWRGDADYLSYVKMVVGLLPGGSELVKVANEAVEYTEKARKMYGQAKQGYAIAKSAVEQGKKVKDGKAPDAQGLMQFAKDGGLFNAGSDFAKDRLGKQVAFIKDNKEYGEVQGLIRESSLMKSKLQKVPGVGGEPADKGGDEKQD